MRRMFVSVSAIIALILPAMVCASTWHIDPDHTSIGFRVKHMMVSNVKGSFDKHTGTVELNDKDITKSKVEVTIDANSVNTNVQKRDDDLRSANFFDVAKYPTMTFVSTKITKAAHGGLSVTGNLTIRGVTKPVVLAVEPLSKESKDPWGNIRRGTSANARINRKDFGLTYNKALETGGVLVGDEITINLEIEMIKVVPK